MTPYERFFSGKRITVLGLGLLGRSVGDAEFLAQLGVRIVVTDKKSEEELRGSVDRLKGYSNVVFHLGGHIVSDFTDTDMVIKAAGVPLDSLEIAAARAAGVPVYMSTALFAKFALQAGAVLVGVTGTRGKSTVAYMIHHVLRKAGKRAHLGGNIRGRSTLAMLPDVKKGDMCVLELDSWQLQGFGDLEISPHVSVFTNLMSDHLNYYGGDLEKYFADKANVFRFQKSGDVLIAGVSVAERIRASEPPLDPIVPEPLPRDWKLKVLGEHNRENASFAAAALQALGISDADIQRGLGSFEGVEGRLQFVREIGSVKIYNDNNATTPEATLAALKALRVEAKGKRQKAKVILIMGGSDKGLDMSALIEEIDHSCKALILLTGTGTDSLLTAYRLPLTAKTYGPLDSLDRAVRKALDLAAEGDVVLFSPAFASFGMFKNEYDRNDQFLLITRKIL